MNDIMNYKETKRIMKYGIPKTEAKSIVRNIIEVVEINNCNELERCVNYALSLIYMIEF